MTSLVNPQQYLQQAAIIYDETAVNQAISALANQLNQYYVDEPPILLCVMGGAVYFTGQLLAKLQFALELDCVQATRYQGEIQGKTLKWLIKPKATIKNRKVLIVDDILDEGLTLKAMIDACAALGAKEIKSAVLIEKMLDKSKPVSADYVGLTVPNRYVFGCGMDIYGWWRNLPAIYALKNT